MADQLLFAVENADTTQTEIPLKDRYWQFIYARHMIWYKRFVLEQPAPWTDDPIMRDYKFTNVYRELDRGTLYLLDHIIGEVETHGDPRTQVFNTIMYRMFNRISTWDHIKDLGVPWNRKQAVRKLQEVYKCGEPIYTDAHMVCAYTNEGGENKLESISLIFDRMEEEMDDLMEVVYRAKSLQTIWNRLVAMAGLGPFLAYEIAVDISYAPWNNHGEDEWVNPGPGCQRGLKFMFPDLKTKDCTWKLRELRQIQNDEFRRLGLPFEAIAYKGRELTLRNIEHCCCEFQKWVKAFQGSGRPRNKFRPMAVIGATDHKRLKG